MKFTKELHLTSVGYLYVSEHHLMHTDLKACMRDIIRANRPCVSQVSVTLIPVPPGDPERCRGHTVAWQVSQENLHAIPRASATDLSAGGGARMAMLGLKPCIVMLG